ncbi:MAG: ABC transporter ATP-binding protein [Candidatus Margulisbacteria bacterium]|nr:ABC transporter ATP-binding protein [Candidatus Margulisiibacteriota bacterium]
MGAIIKFIKDFFSLLTIRDRVYLVVLIALSVVVSFVELFSLSMVVPFLALVSNQQLLLNNKYLSAIYNYFSFSSPLIFLFIFGCLLLFLIIFRGLVNVLYTYFLVKFSRTRYRTLSFRLFEKYLGLDYIDYSKGSSSSFIHNTLNESLNFTSFLYAALVLFSEVMIISIIYVLLILINWKITISLSIGIAIVSWIIAKVANPILKNAGVKRNQCQSKLISTLNETFGNYKYIKLMTDKSHFKENFFHSSSGFVRAEAIQGLFLVIPRIIMETGGICLLLIILLYALFLYKDPAVAVTLLTMYAIAFFRLLPSVNKILVNWGYLIFFKGSISKLAIEFRRDCEDLGDKFVNFSEKISLDGVSFGYDKNQQVLKDIKLAIPKGSKFAIVGPSGCGKSTLVDILTGLLVANKGTIRIDDVLLDKTNINSWRKNIGYIPQNIYLFEGTVKENVICGRKEDELKVINALKIAKIYDFLLTKDGVDTIVGENGIMLSGGQKQRIGIARALYDSPSVLILDEATSALDQITENDIIQEILGIDGELTIIIVTHREYFLKNCDLVYKMGD